MWFKKKDKGAQTIQGNAPVDYKGLFVSMGQGQELFNQLKKRCHPDRFVGTEKYHIAEELFKEVQANSTNYDALMKLRARIDNDLL